MTRPMTNEAFHDIHTAMRRAARATWLVRNDDRDADAWAKEDKTPVTVADLAAQAFILGAIARHFPEDNIFAEEDPASLADDTRASRVREVMEEVLGTTVSNGEINDAVGHRGDATNTTRWFVDPLDGTKGFVRGLLYAVAAARCVDGQLERSWLAVPGKAEALPSVVGGLYHAVAGEGAWMCKLSGDDEPSTILPPDLPAAEEILATNLKVVGSRAHGGATLPKPIEDAGIPATNIPVDSQAKYAALAVGEAHLYARKPSASFGAFFAWDHAPGALLLQELGGRVTDINGKEMDWMTGSRLEHNEGLLATINSDIHDHLLPVFRSTPR
ncbi:hypothetical protein GF324_08455 [bacterium]|nr:hypothetical protein [bacterium]